MGRVWQKSCIVSAFGRRMERGACFKDSAQVINQLFVSGKWPQRYDETVCLVFLKGGRHVLWPTLKVLWASFSGSEQENNVYFQGCNIVRAIFCIAKRFSIWFGCYPVSLHISMHFKGVCGLWPWDKLALMSCCCCCCCNNSVQTEKCHTCSYQQTEIKYLLEQDIPPPSFSASGI